LLKKKLKSRYKGFWLRTLFSRPTNLHQRGDTQWRIAHRDLAPDNRSFPDGTWRDEAHAVLTDILHASCYRTYLRILDSAELRQLSDNYIKDLGKPHFVTSIGLDDAFHVYT
jgi:hypothetical protein